MTTTSPGTTTRYNNLLALLASAPSPLVAVDGSATKLSFEFPSDAPWVDAESLMDTLASDDDKGLLSIELPGGRIRRPAAMIDVLDDWSDVPGAVSSQSTWDAMIDLLEQRLHLGRESADSFQKYAELFDEILHALQPDTTGRYDSWVEVQQVDIATGAPIGDAEWMPVALENFMGESGAIIDGLELAYGGRGHTAELTIRSGDTAERFELNFPASAAVAALLEHHIEAVDPMHQVPVLQMLNECSSQEGTAMLALAGCEGHVWGAVPACVPEAPTQERDAHELRHAISAS